MTKKKIRRERKRKHTCFDCDPNIKYHKSELKNRKRVPRCFDHAEEYDQKNSSTWPPCPKCGSETEFGTMHWNGSVKGTIVSCDDCDFADDALNHFDRVDIKIIASPIEKEK